MSDDVTKLNAAKLLLLRHETQYHN